MTRDPVPPPRMKPAHWPDPPSRDPRPTSDSHPGLRPASRSSSFRRWVTEWQPFQRLGWVLLFLLHAGAANFIALLPTLPNEGDGGRSILILFFMGMAVISLGFAVAPRDRR